MLFFYPLIGGDDPRASHFLELISFFIIQCFKPLISFTCNCLWRFQIWWLHYADFCCIIMYIRIHLSVSWDLRILCCVFYTLTTRTLSSDYPCPGIVIHYRWYDTWSCNSWRNGLDSFCCLIVWTVDIQVILPSLFLDFWTVKLYGLWMMGSLSSNEEIHDVLWFSIGSQCWFGYICLQFS